MLTKNCRIVLKAIRSQGKAARYESYSAQKLMDLTGLAIDPLSAACRLLALEGLMEVTHLSFSRGNMDVIDSVQLTEIGANYSEKQQADRLHYIASYWISFLALIVATISLIRTF